MPSVERPLPTEYAPYYASYLDQVPAGDILHLLARQRDQVRELLAGREEEWGNHRYSPDKWSVKEVLGHLIDTERLFAFRALWIARGDPEPQPGMDQDIWVASGRFEARTLADLLDEYRIVREASLALFCSFTSEDWARRGIANQVSFTARSLPYIIAGHELHHVRILQERYF